MVQRHQCLFAVAVYSKYKGVHDCMTVSTYVFKLTRMTVYIVGARPYTEAAGIADQGINLSREVAAMLCRILFEQHDSKGFNPRIDLVMMLSL